MDKLIKQRILRLRGKHRYSQEEVADHMGISQSAYNRLEYGDVSVKVSHLTKLSELYNIDIAYFFEDGYQVHDDENQTVVESAGQYIPKPRSRKMMIEVDLTSEEYAEILPILKRKFGGKL